MANRQKIGSSLMNLKLKFIELYNSALIISKNVILRLKLRVTSGQKRVPSVASFSKFHYRFDSVLKNMYKSSKS